ncbi:MAG TPA: TonB-dependent receptor [Candidatus Baltobacteraceae bacterium]
MRRLLSALAALGLFSLPLTAWPGTTGSLHGHIVDASTAAPVAGVAVTAVSPSQTATAVTDAGGNFSLISLIPDTYAVSTTKTGYEPISYPGVVVYADQSQTVNISLPKALKTIAHTTSRSAQSLVHAGVTSDLYSVGPSGQKASQTLAGSGSMTQAYGAIASAPGVNMPSNQQGWYQGLSIRGGDVDQVAYELDGLQLTRQSDLAPIGTLSTLGSQEVQVYTGGTPATSNSSGLAGYINQVLKTGTYPGYADGELGAGTPSFYHEAMVEAGGATPDRLFSYYVGFSGTNQTFRYGDQFNGAGEPLYFYPLWVPSNNAEYYILDGSAGKAPNYGALFSPGYSYAQGYNADRESIANLHLGIPHKNSPLRDDIQLLYIVGGIHSQYLSSQQEMNYTPKAGSCRYTCLGYPFPYLDSYIYNGALMQTPNPNDVTIQLLPSSQTGRAPGSPVPVNLRDGNWNDYAIEKFQYQKNFNPSSYLRFLGYSAYSDWFISGADAAELPFGSDLPDYEVLEHGYGAGLMYSNQLSARNLLTAQTTFTSQKLQTYNATFSSTDPATNSLLPTGLGSILSNYVGSNGRCYNYATGAPWSCFDAHSQGGCLLTGYDQSSGGCYPGFGGSFNLEPGNCVTGGSCAGSAAARAHAHWIMTENGQSAQVDDVQPYFTSYSLTDLWQPNDRLVVNVGARLDHFAYVTNDLASGYPARQFWFSAYNREHCGAVGSYPVWTWNGSGFGACPAGTTPLTQPGNGLYNSGSNFFVSNVFQPRASFTYTINQDTVLRGSYGKYARAEGSSYYEYNTYQQNLASFIAQFYAYGYHTPDHQIYPDTSNNYDLSLEQHLHGTKFSYKITPFYRDTRNQLQFLAIDPVEGTLAGLNVGNQESYGAELSLQYGDFARDGLSGQLSYTYTADRIKFSPINGQSVIGGLNSQIALYNSYTSACASVTARSPNWQACGGGVDAGNAQSIFTNACGKGCTVKVPNPYYHLGLQPLLDPNGWYEPYDVIPTPFNGANGYNVPNVASLILNYRHGKFAVTPSLRYSDGTSYGSPLSWPGYVPQTCTAPPSRTPATPGMSCPGTATEGAIMLPDPYTGKFDNLGSLREPSQLALNMQLSYDVSPKVSLTLQAVNLYSSCFQRGYAWDNSVTCVYSSLPSNILPPAGNFVRNPPVQLKYPYGTFFNVTEVGISSTTQPFNLFGSINVKL